MYKVIKSFDGSPNGCDVNHYEKGEVLDHSAFGDSLVEVALKEKWIEAHEAKKTKKTQTVTVTVEMIKDGMTIPEMQAALKGAGIATRVKSEAKLANLILENGLFKA
jgi:hypothetical protein